MVNSIGIYHYLFLGLLVFIAGLLGAIFSKNVIKVLICIEFIILGVNINFITFGTFCDNTGINGYVFVIFYTVIGAVEFALAIYIFHLMYKAKQSEFIESYGEL